MLTQQVALVSETTKIDTSELTRVGASLQKQAIRDFGPLWGVQATVDAFVRLEDVPLGYWPIIVRDDIQTANAAGIHLDQDGQPFSLVRWSPQWSLTASHECLEMLADPFGNRLVAGNSLMTGQGRVEYLVEVCDPSEAAEFAYASNGVLVSDFYTPNYFDPVGVPGVRYSFTGALQQPRQVLRDGYLSWHDPVTDRWFQLTFFGGIRRFRDLGTLARRNGSIRSRIDLLTEEERDRVLKMTVEELEAEQKDEAGVGNSLTVMAMAWDDTGDVARVIATSILPAEDIKPATDARAARLRKQIDALYER